MAGQKTDIVEGARFDALAEFLEWVYDCGEEAANVQLYVGRQSMAAEMHAVLIRWKKGYSPEGEE